MSRMQEKIHQPIEPVYAGIDVSKNTLDFFVYPHGIIMEVKNDKSGIRTIIKQCKEHDVHLLALEATGKYHRMPHEMLHAAGVKTAVVNPFRSRQFAESMGRFAKTDKIDAQVLSRFAERMKPEPTIPATEHYKNLRELHTARRQVVGEISDLKRQLKTAHHPLAAKQIRSRINMGQRHKDVLEQEIQNLINENPQMIEKFQILTTIPGIGKITAAILIADLSELGQVNAKQIAALAGVAPMNWDSGTKCGNRMIRGGRKSVRNAMYMCAVSNITKSGLMGSFYRKLISRGKPPKVALTAVMRKMIIIANTLITENRAWEPECP